MKNVQSRSLLVEIEGLLNVMAIEAVVRRDVVQILAGVHAIYDRSDPDSPTGKHRTAKGYLGVDQDGLPRVSRDEREKPDRRARSVSVNTL